MNKVLWSCHCRHALDVNSSAAGVYCLGLHVMVLISGGLKIHLITKLYPCARNKAHQVGSVRSLWIYLCGRAENTPSINSLSRKKEKKTLVPALICTNHCYTRMPGYSNLNSSLLPHTHSYWSFTIMGSHWLMGICEVQDGG